MGHKCYFGIYAVPKAKRNVINVNISLLKYNASNFSCDSIMLIKQFIEGNHAECSDLCQMI